MCFQCGWEGERGELCCGADGVGMKCKQSEKEAKQVK